MYLRNVLRNSTEMYPNMYLRNVLRTCTEMYLDMYLGMYLKINLVPQAEEGSGIIPQTLDWAI